MPRHSTSGSGALMHKSRAHGAGLRAHLHPAMFQHAIDMGSVCGGGYSTSGGRATKAGATRNVWVAHVKAYAKKHGCTYGEALHLARPSYHHHA
jgi:ribosomal protein L20